MEKNLPSLGRFTTTTTIPITKATASTIQYILNILAVGLALAFIYVFYHVCVQCNTIMELIGNIRYFNYLVVKNARKICKAGFICCLNAKNIWSNASSLKIYPATLTNTI